MRIEYDRKSFKVDGKRIFIIGGEIHYFRIPRETWYDRLMPLIAKHQITQQGTIILAQIENEYEEIYDGWGDKELHLKMKAHHVERLTRETLAYGGMGFDSYMWSGGTNFGY